MILSRFVNADDKFDDIESNTQETNSMTTKSSISRLFWKFIFKPLVLVGYYVVGIVFFAHYESWTLEQTIYFITVSSKSQSCIFYFLKFAVLYIYFLISSCIRFY